MKNRTESMNVSWAALAAGTLALSAGAGCSPRLEGDNHEQGPLSVEVVEAFPNLEFERPLWFGPAPDGSDRVFVLEQRGRVLWFDNDEEVAQEDVAVALDITGQVRSPVSDVSANRGGNEEGLLGMAFHPEWEENGHVFLHYSETSPDDAPEPQRGVVARFEMDRDSLEIDAGSEERLLLVDQFRGNHNGGMVAFGPDGYLYLSFGDGGGAGDPQKNGQDLGTLLGAILRIDVDSTDGEQMYSIPEDNPFVDRDGARPEIYAYGLRNVWRFSFDPESGDLWAGDVCQNSWEKIFLIEKGHNYGWPLMEGTEPYDGIPDDVDPDSLTPPIIEHPHAETRSITGGYIYSGEAVPELEGAYVYGDYVTGVLFALWYDRESGEVERHERLGSAPSISSFGVDHRDELYIVSLDGTIHRLESGE